MLNGNIRQRKALQMQKTIFLIDMNAFFISCEITRNPKLAGIPSAVAGDPKNRTGIILAANYEARAYGVKTAMVLHEALKLCPKLCFVPPDHIFYEEKSKQVMNLLANYSPTIEQNSIDEAWLDMAGTECLFGEPYNAAQKIMSDIKDNLGLWCSIGISENKFLSKMASEMKKPLGITELWKKDIPTKLWPLHIDAMYGIGRKTAEKLNRLGIKTIGELAQYDKTIILKSLGKSGLNIHDNANGLDNEPVTARAAGDMKSIGRAETLPEDIADIEKAKNVLLELCDDVGMTARKYGKKGRTIQITLKYSDFKSITRQSTIPETNTTVDIYKTGCKLLEENWNKLLPVRLIGISISGFNDNFAKQISIFDFIGITLKNNKQEQIDKAMDKIRNKHGIEKISRASLIKKS